MKSKGLDFYFEPPGGFREDYFHLSLHGPRDGLPSHRFHIKASDAAAERSGKRLFRSVFPKRGAEFVGKQLCEDAWLVVRFRWSWLLQRERYRSVARQSIGSELIGSEQALRLNAPLANNSFWDIDFVVSYDSPYWRGEEAWSRESAHDVNARAIELANDSGMWLTATSHHRNGLLCPTPPEVAPRAPRSLEDAALFTGGAIGSDGVFWLVSTITTKAIFEDDDERKTIWPDVYHF